MIPAHVKGATNLFSKPENWDNEAMGACGDLHVRVQQGAGDVVEMVSAWKPGGRELAMLNAGGVVEVFLCQAGQPPMAVGVAFEHQSTVETKAPVTTINEEGHGLGYDEHGPATP